MNEWLVQYKEKIGIQMRARRLLLHIACYFKIYSYDAHSVMNYTFNCVVENNVKPVLMFILH